MWQFKIEFNFFGPPIACGNAAFTTSVQVDSEATTLIWNFQIEVTSNFTVTLDLMRQSFIYRGADSMNPILQQGSFGADVLRLKELLNKQLTSDQKLSFSLIFDEKTTFAVMTIQSKFGLRVNGVVTSEVWECLINGRPTVEESLPFRWFNYYETPWIAYALPEQGQKAVDGKKSHNPRVVEYHSTTTYRAANDETAWCSAFVNWCLTKAGIQGTNNAAANSWLTWGRQTTPRIGAITVIQRADRGYHVAFYQGEYPGGIWIFGGNQSSRVKSSHYLLRTNANKHLKNVYLNVEYRWPK